MRRLQVALIIVLVAAALAIALLFGVRVTALSDNRLEPWHTLVPHELDPSELEQADWAGYIRAENQLFATLQQALAGQMPADQHSPYNRFYDQSLVYPGNLSHDWNRSYIAEPVGPVRGAVVLLHGLTDSPYSLRHFAGHFQAMGLLAVAIRLPGHGTVPAGLTTAHWEDWMAATRLAVREAARRLPPGAPLYVVGFSNGGALAVKYALDALEQPELRRPDHLILISPMIGVTRYARFAGIAGLPALFPAFAKAAWLSLVPEFNPFKYNSFPVNAARQTYELTEAVRVQLDKARGTPAFRQLPPMLTFQSLVDHTVSTRAIKSTLYDRLPANGSELVLFDTNRSLPLNSLLRPSVVRLRSELTAPQARPYALTLVGAKGEDDPQTFAYQVLAGQTQGLQTPLNIAYPRGLFSLSHVALPFPPDDPLYGQQPSPARGMPEQYGLRLGTLHARGERGTLIFDADTFARATSNPFFGFMLRHMDEALALPPKD